MRLTAVSGLDWHIAASIRATHLCKAARAPRSVTRARTIIPDAIVELPGRRCFLEMEMGTHSIESTSPDKDGATTRKAERYENFLHGFAHHQPDVTFYEHQFPDRRRPEVLILVRNEGRRDRVNGALAAWRRGRGAPASQIRAVTIDEAGADFRRILGVPMARSAPVTRAALAGGAVSGNGDRWSGADAALVSRFFDEATRTLRQIRHQLEAVSEAERSRLGLVKPLYPATIREMQSLLTRLG